MRRFAACGLLLGACLSGTALADPTYTFVVNDLTSGSTLQFSLDPNSYTTQGYGDYEYAGISGSEGSTADTFNVSIDPYATTGDYLGIFGTNVSLDALFTPQFLSGTADGTDPVVTTGSTFLGTEECVASLQMPFVHSSALPGTMAFLQFGPYGFTCNDALQLSVTANTTPSSVTPEPASLGLLATGVLGVAGVVRRRLRG